tara:strand:- start:200 stop:904 length:705 start_codon:yes stop_codon:yes gene_type:complete
MYLAIDVGNTFVKYAIFKEDRIVYSNKSDLLDEKIISQISFDYNIRSLIISSVRKEKKISLDLDVLYLSYRTNLPISIDYKSPETLGNDRIANICAATSLFPEKDILIIDSGSCITMDYISKEHKYLGGRISPGLQMRYESLNYFTEKLPKLDFRDEFMLLGDSTNSCIISGVQNGIIAEIDDIITEIKKEKPDLFVLGTGGDIFFFEKALKNPIFADSNLLMKGLNKILQYNV